MPRREKILIVDDSPLSRKILGRAIASEYDVEYAQNGREAVDILERNGSKISGVLLDLVMPVMDGFEFMREIAGIDELRSMPVIAVTAEGDGETEERALELGAWDYVTKPFRPNVLLFRLRKAIERSQLKLLDRLKHSAEYDGLTEIYGRKKFFEATRELLDANRSEKFVYIRFDIENFKLINSFFGVEAGDKLLVWLAEGIKRYAKRHGKMTYGRMGADVFGICMPFTTRQDVIESSERARNMLRGYMRDFELVPDFGIYIIADNSMDVPLMNDYSILAARDIKGSYVNCYSFYEDDMSDRIKNDQWIINNMNIALESGQFHVYFQPKYEVGSNRPYGAEALVRWFHPERGIISPNEFIPVFERNGFICKLDYCVWEQVCAIMSGWKADGRLNAPVSVNVSRVNLFNPKLPELLSELTEKYGVPPEMLNLEITESAYTDNTYKITRTIEKLRERGFVIMMDDFGSGYSSLNALKDLPVDILKVDMKFLPTDHSVRAERVLASVIRMAKYLGMPVIVEGVETEEQTTLLQGLGTDYIQGFYFAKPMPVDEYEKLMDADRSSEYSEERGEKLLDMIIDSVPEGDILFGSIPEPIALIGYDGGHIDLIRANSGFKDMTGMSETRNLELDRFVDSESEKSISDAIKRTALERTPSECDYIRLDDGRPPVWIHMKAQYVTSSGDREILVAMFSDVTHQKQLEIKLAAYRCKLAEIEAETINVLVVDDQELNRVALRTALRESCAVREASGGAEALELLRKSPEWYDVVLLDLIMPEMSGQEVLVHKNSDPEIRDIPVIIISADGAKDVQLGALRSGVSDFVVKPFVPEVVERRVRNVVESSKSRTLRDTLLPTNLI